MHGTGSVVVVVSVFFIPLDFCSAIVVVLVVVQWFCFKVVFMVNSPPLDTSIDITQQS